MPKGFYDREQAGRHKPQALMQSNGRLVLADIMRAAREPAQVINPILYQAAQRVRARRDTLLPTIDPVEWIEHEFYIPETRQPMKLAKYQARALREALSKDERGLFKYSTVIWADIKKSAKTSIAAAVVDYMLANMPFASAKFVANDLDQADSRAAKMLRTNFKLHPRADMLVVPSRNLIRYPNESEVLSIPIDPSGEAGGNDNIIAFDELWGAHEKAKQTMWTEMTLSPTKFGKSLRWVSSYAGHQGESELLWSLYQQGVDSEAQFPGAGHKFGWCDEFDPPLECYYNDAARLFCLWNTVPRLAWQTPEYYAQESATLTTSEFSRVHRNQWATAQEQFVPIEWWDACADESLNNLTWWLNEAHIVALDAAVSRDCFGIVGVARNRKFRDHVDVRFMKLWTPPKGGTIDFVNQQDPTDAQYPEGYLRKNYKRFNIIEHAYDPMHLSEMPKRLMRAGYGFYRVFPQNRERLVADKLLYDLIRDRRIHHNGKLTELRTHIQNANVETHDEKHLRIVKRAASLHIDLAVALSMACARALHYNL